MGKLVDPTGLGPVVERHPSSSLGWCTRRSNYMSYICKCGKEFQTNSSFAGHCSHCRIHLGHEPTDNFGEGRGWSLGKTKETDIRIAKAAEKQKRMIHEGLIAKAFQGKQHSLETRLKMSVSAKERAKQHKTGWKGGDSHIQNKYEVFTEDFLIKHGISYQSEVTVPKSSLGASGSYYQFDFLIEGRIDLEIDGTSHLKPDIILHDNTRDLIVSSQYRVYRIQHHDDLDTLELELYKFLKVYGELD